MELRCKQCNKMFAEWEDNKLKIVCHRCGHWNVFSLIKEYISHKLTKLYKKE